MHDKDPARNPNSTRPHLSAGEDSGVKQAWVRRTEEAHRRAWADRLPSIYRSFKSAAGDASLEPGDLPRNAYVCSQLCHDDNVHPEASHHAKVLAGRLAYWKEKHV